MTSAVVLLILVSSPLRIPFSVARFAWKLLYTIVYGVLINIKVKKSDLVDAVILSEVYGRVGFIKRVDH